MKSISIIIPTWNEEDNILPLVTRIHQTLKDKNILYEIIFIDDFSIDNTEKNIKKLSNDYPIQFYSKKGKRGKAHSLLQGFTKANYDVICIIDADLQYPPEVIPQMFEKITTKESDIVVANRLQQETGIKRKIASHLFLLFFGKLLHGLSIDVQSGLKMFKKEIIQRISLNPTPWTFDLEFLTKARHAGYSISSVDITFAKRFSGKSKVGLIKASFEIGLSALKVKMRNPGIIPFHPKQAAIEGLGFHYKGSKYYPYNDLHHSETAFYVFNLDQALLLLILFFSILVFLLINWHATIVGIISFLTFLYFCDIFFNLFLIYRSFSKKPEITVKKEELENVKEWPTYTIFCPLYKEWEVLPQFVNAIQNIEYPKDKLEVLLLLEENDATTIEKAQEYNLPSYFSIIIIPNSIPKTKPKAVNYGLTKSLGKFCVIYDAEDIPDPLQLKKAVIAFKKATNKTICIQAKLNFYNPHQNILTRVFTAEYSLWFDLILPGLQSIGAPIPLGGTSNHFRVEELQALKGWDSFNVTEDCDLGIRLAKNGASTAIIDSVTLEEANSQTINWIHQRTRWIKGYIQTYLVHTRNLQAFIKHENYIHIVTFQLIIGGKLLSLFVNPLMWLITITYFVFRPQLGIFIESFFPTVILYIGVFSLVLGNFLYLYYYMIACAKKGYYDIIKFVFFVPFYWVSMSIAAWIALYGVIRNPHYWAKTRHGLHLNNQDLLKQLSETVQKNLIPEEKPAYQTERILR